MKIGYKDNETMKICTNQQYAEKTLGVQCALWVVACVNCIAASNSVAQLVAINLFFSIKQEGDRITLHKNNNMLILYPCDDEGNQSSDSDCQCVVVERFEVKR